MAGGSRILFRRMVGGGFPEIRRFAENNNCTFLAGTPVKLESGYVEPLAEANNNNCLAGIAIEPGANLAADGTAETLTYGSVINQNNAVNIPQGAPINDGKCGVLIASQHARFMGTVGNNNNLAQAMVGAVHGLVKDSNNYWYIDNGVNGAGNGYVVITELIDAVGTANGKVEFRILDSRIDSTLN
jgi:hypothetical protein